MLVYIVCDIRFWQIDHISLVAAALMLVLFSVHIVVEWCVYYFPYSVFDLKFLILDEL